MAATAAAIGVPAAAAHQPVGGPPRSRGFLLLVPYLLIFGVFVVYPVLYGLWLGRHADDRASTDAAPALIPLDRDL